MKRKRVNMIIGKKQLALMSLTCVLALAIYGNHLMGQSPNGLISSTEEKENYGDTQFVSGDIDEQKDTTKEYFATYGGFLYHCGINAFGKNQKQFK